VWSKPSAIARLDLSSWLRYSYEAWTSGNKATNHVWPSGKELTFCLVAPDQLTLDEGDPKAALD
jgi:hypothetical protein